MQLKHTQNIYTVCEEGVVTELTFLKWFAKFHAGCFLLDNIARPCTPVDADNHQVEASRAVSVCRREAAAALRMPRPRTEKHSCQLAYVNRCDVWVPRKQREKPSWPSFHMQFSSER